MGSDQTEILRAGYWPSYNVPFHEQVGKNDSCFRLELYELKGHTNVAVMHNETGASIYLYLSNLSIYLSIYLSVCLSVCLSVYLSIIKLSVSLPFCLSIHWPSLNLSIYLSNSLLISLPFCLSIYQP